MTARRAERVLLALGAVLGSLCLVMALAAMAFDLRPLVFRSGSMAPTIETGDLALAQEVPASDLAVGDVVSVKNSDGTRVTHRIVTVTQRGDHATLALKGDANSAADIVPYDVETADRVIVSVPDGGFILAWLSGPLGLFLLGGYAVWLLTRVARPRPRLAESGRAGAPAMAAVGVLGLLGMVGVHANVPFTLAAWNDTAGVSGTKLTAYTVTKPAITGCTITGGLGQKTATIVWTEVSSPHALDYVATIVETGQSMTVTDNGATRQTLFSASLLSTVLNQTYNIRITARLPTPNGSWVSVNTNQPVTIGLLGVSMSCGVAS